MLEAALDSIISITSDSRVVEWNAAAEKTFGYTVDQAVGRDVAALIIPPEYRDRHYKGMARYMGTGDGPVIGHRVELEAMRSDGSRFPVELAISPIEIEGQVHFTAYLRDISVQQRAETEILESRQRLESTYEHAFAGIAEVDENGRYLRVNEEFSVITGYSREELLTRTFNEITADEDRGPDFEQFRRQVAGEIDSYQMEKRYIHKAGHVVWIELASSTVADNEGHPVYFVRVARDVTERKRSEEHLQLLVHELNHRVKNTLATVQSIASQTFRTATNVGEARKAFEERLLALSRVHNLLTRESWESARLQEVVAEAIQPYREERNDRFQVRGPDIRLPPRTALALSLALQELTTNALKYGSLSNDQGTVEITWELDRSTHPSPLSFVWKERGGPLVAPPQRKGFGSRLIERSLAEDLGGNVAIHFEPTGVICTVQTLL
jgi:PAS domain S-box-containing protein